MPVSGNPEMVPQHYTEGTAVLIGGGPSLTTEQVETCREPHAAGDLIVMGCNDAYRICDFLDVLYAADGRWIDHHHENVPEGPECWTADRKNNQVRERWNRVAVAAGQGDGLSLDREVLVSGNHSGYQLINLAYLMGCRTLILIGYDCRGGGTHWFGQHPTPAMQVKSNFEIWVKNFQAIAESCTILNLTIINATPNSAIDAFPRLTLDAALPGEDHG